MWLQFQIYVTFEHILMFSDGYHDQLNIDSGNALVPPGNKSMPEVLITKFHDAICL